MPSTASSPSTHRDLALEQAHLDRAYQCLDAMQVQAVRLADRFSITAKSDFNDASVERAMHRYRAALDVSGPLCFGRIDGGGERWYVGRRHVEDESGDTVVVDWRAGVAMPFYRATFADPLGLAQRRRFALDGRLLVELFDENFADPDSAHNASGIPDPLLAELDRSRSGQMRDIVATIQAEQDRVIRAPLDRLLIVQGGPGTGKTAVGLHRAALLLYDHRDVLERDGVLVVGPNRLFLRYISHVLPSLGETAVVQTTVSGLSPLTATGIDTDDAARVKGDSRMAMVIARTAWDRMVPADTDVAVRTSFGNLTLTTQDINDALTTALAEATAEHRTVTSGRDHFRAMVTKVAFQRLVARRPDGLKSSDAVSAALRASADLRRGIGRAWPATTAPALVRRLLTNKATLANAADGILAPAEQRTLVRKAAKRAADEAWTAADLVLMDEADAVLGARTRRFGHIVVDEAQDLSAMAWRMMARRCARFPSMTVLGDLAQSTTPSGQASWDDVVAALGHPQDVQPAELDIGYRVPEQILDFANRLLPAAGVAVAPTRSARATADPPEILTVDEPASAAVDAATALAVVFGTVAVIAPGDLHEAIVAAGLPIGEALAAPISLLTPIESKGLEFDAVVVVEPRDIAGADEHGVRLLYVALTRAVQHLTVVHANGLPDVLAG
jgi:DNA helicase IV